MIKISFTYRIKINLLKSLSLRYNSLNKSELRLSYIEREKVLKKKKDKEVLIVFLKSLKKFKIDFKH